MDVNIRVVRDATAHQQDDLMVDFGNARVFVYDILSMYPATLPADAPARTVVRVNGPATFQVALAYEEANARYKAVASRVPAMAANGDDTNGDDESDLLTGLQEVLGTGFGDASGASGPDERVRARGGEALHRRGHRPEAGGVWEHPRRPDHRVPDGGTPRPARGGPEGAPDGPGCAPAADDPRSRPPRPVTLRGPQRGSRASVWEDDRVSETVPPSTARS